MKYLFVMALMAILLVTAASALPEDVVANIEMSASGGAITQVASNTVVADDDGTSASESISMTASGTGVVTQAAQNNALVVGDDSTVVQTVTMEAQGSDVNQAAQNNLAVAGDDSTAEQSISQTGTATTGNVNQVANNNAAALGNDVSVTQSVTLAAAAERGFVTQQALDTAVVFGARANIEQTITASALARNDIVQLFGNAAFGQGNGARYTQVIMGSANSTRDNVFQIGGNLAGQPGLFNNVRANQSVIFSAVANDDILQIGGNAFGANNGATIGQEVQMAADGDDVAQVGGNLAIAGNNFAANQAIALDVESDRGNVAQIAGNAFVDLNNGGNSNSALGQMISGRSAGSDNTLQVFANFALLNHDAGNVEYTVTQSNVADATGRTFVGQFQTNTVLWELNADGAWGTAMSGTAAAPTVLQFQTNALIPV